MSICVRCGVYSRALFQDGLTRVSVNGEVCNIDRTGVMVVRPPADVFVTGLGEFSDGLATVLGLDHRFGFMDKTGTVAMLAPSSGDASEGRSFHVAWAYIDKSGNIVWQQE